MKTVQDVFSSTILSRPKFYKWKSDFPASLNFVQNERQLYTMPSKEHGKNTLFGKNVPAASLNFLKIKANTTRNDIKENVKTNSQKLQCVAKKASHSIVFCHVKDHKWFLEA